MNMRAAEATVSSAPKAMKIFPISEVLSSVELSLPASADARLQGHHQAHRAGRALDVFLPGVSEVIVSLHNHAAICARVHHTPMTPECVLA
jgi:hypothetical protein